MSGFGLSFRRAFKCKINYVWNSVAFGLMLTFFITLRILSTIAKPTHRGFYCDDETILHTKSDKEDFPNWALYIYIVLLPLATVVFGSFIPRLANKTATASITTTRQTRLLSIIAPPTIQFLWYLFGLGALVATVDSIKLYAGELRPQFLGICNPDFSALNCTKEGIPVYVTEYECRGDPHAIREARLSFPSGHSAYSMYAALFAAFYLSKIPLITLRSPLQLLFMGVVLLSSVLIGVSRIVNNRHHPHDILIGFAIGILFAIVVVFYNLQYFKSDSCRSQSAHPVERNDSETRPLEETA